MRGGPGPSGHTLLSHGGFVAVKEARTWTLPLLLLIWHSHGMPFFFQGGNSSEALPSTHATLKAISPQSSGWNPLQLNNFLHLVSVPPNDTPRSIIIIIITILLGWHPVTASQQGRCSGAVLTTFWNQICKSAQNAALSSRVLFPCRSATWPDISSSSSSSTFISYYVSDVDSELIGGLRMTVWNYNECNINSEEPKCWYLHTECKNMSTWNNYVTKRLFYGCKDVKSQRILSQS